LKALMVVAADARSRGSHGVFVGAYIAGKSVQTNGRPSARATNEIVRPASEKIMTLMKTSTTD